MSAELAETRMKSKKVNESVAPVTSAKSRDEERKGEGGRKERKNDQDKAGGKLALE